MTQATQLDPLSSSDFRLWLAIHRGEVTLDIPPVRAVSPQRVMGSVRASRAPPNNELAAVLRWIAHVTCEETRVRRTLALDAKAIDDDAKRCLLYIADRLERKTKGKSGRPAGHREAIVRVKARQYFACRVRRWELVLKERYPDLRSGAQGVGIRRLGIVPSSPHDAALACVSRETEIPVETLRNHVDELRSILGIPDDEWPAEPKDHAKARRRYRLELKRFIPSPRALARLLAASAEPSPEKTPD